jgi:hypothetical protein
MTLRTGEAGPPPDRAAAVAHERIRAGTFPDMGDAAISLYDRLTYEASIADEAVDFSGQLGLDVGGYDGCYRSLIGALGLRRVITVEPNPPHDPPVTARPSVPHTRGGLYIGTVQHWVDHTERPADSVFVFNMAPSASRDQTFLRALSAATRMRGLLAVTFREAGTCQMFLDGVRRNPTLGFRQVYSREEVDRSNAPPGPPRGPSVRDQYLALFRREPAA